MRKILFRGKRADNSEWEYGDLWCNPYGKRVVCIVSPINDQGTTGGNEVDPETVGQYTGVPDKNGTKIFEGDIVEILTENEEIGVVEYDDGGFQIESDGFIVDFHTNINGTDLEVIGNIHDNPELLEGGE